MRAEYFILTYKDKAKYKLEALKEAWIKQRAVTLRPKIKVKKLKKKEELDLLAAINQLTWFNKRRSSEKWDDYLFTKPYEASDIPPLEWWLKPSQLERWPNLSKFAVSILSILTMSDAPKKVFSGARRIVSWERSRITPESVEIQGMP